MWKRLVIRWWTLTSIFNYKCSDLGIHKLCISAFWFWKLKKLHVYQFYSVFLIVLIKSSCQKNWGFSDCIKVSLCWWLVQHPKNKTIFKISASARRKLRHFQMILNFPYLLHEALKISISIIFQIWIVYVHIYIYQPSRSSLLQSLLRTHLVFSLTAGH